MNNIQKAVQLLIDRIAQQENNEYGSSRFWHVWVTSSKKSVIIRSIYCDYGVAPEREFSLEDPEYMVTIEKWIKNPNSIEEKSFFDKGMM